MMRKALGIACLFLLIPSLGQATELGGLGNLTGVAYFPDFVDFQIGSEGRYYDLRVYLEALEDTDLSEYEIEIRMEKENFTEPFILGGDWVHRQWRGNQWSEFANINLAEKLNRTVLKKGERVSFGIKTWFSRTGKVVMYPWLKKGDSSGFLKYTYLYIVDPLTMEAISANRRIGEAANKSALAAEASALEAKRIADTTESGYKWILLAAVVGAFVGGFLSYLPERRREIRARKDDYSKLNKEVQGIMKSLKRSSNNLIAPIWKEIEGTPRFYSLHKDMQEDLSTFYEDIEKYGERLWKANDALKAIILNENDGITQTARDSNENPKVKLQDKLEDIIQILYKDRVYPRALLSGKNDFEKSDDFKRLLSEINEEFELKIDPKDYLATLRIQIEKTSEFKDLKEIYSNLISLGDSLENKLEEKIKRHWIRDIFF